MGLPAGRHTDHRLAIREPTNNSVRRNRRDVRISRPIFSRPGQIETEAGIVVRNQQLPAGIGTVQLNFWRMHIELGEYIASSKTAQNSHKPDSIQKGLIKHV